MTATTTQFKQKTTIEIISSLIPQMSEQGLVDLLTAATVRGLNTIALRVEEELLHRTIQNIATHSAHSATTP
jgi:uncharacterized protein YjgD (DUF1641 family)